MPPLTSLLIFVALSSSSFQLFPDERPRDPPDHPGAAQVRAGGGGVPPGSECTDVGREKATKDKV